MTPEELNRTIEFLVQHQAHFSVQMEELSVHLKEMSARQREDKEWGKRLIGELAAQDKRLAELYEIQSRRLDRAESEDRAAQKRHEESEKRNEEFQREALRLLHRILDRLTRNPNSKN